MTRRTVPAAPAARYSAPRGTTLVELLVAMPLAMLAVTAAATILVRLAHTTRVQSGALATARELRHAAQVLAANLESLSGDQLAVVSDTLLEFREQLGLLTLCEVPDVRSVIAVAPRGSSDLWTGALRAGDAVRMWKPATPTQPPLAYDRVLAGSPVALTPQACGTDSVPTRRWRLAFADSLVQGAAGTPVSAHRDARYRHYRSGGAWWIGRQSRDATTWETIQPVAGPLRSPANGGVVLIARNAAGRPLRIDASSADSVRAQVVMLEVRMTMSRRTAARQGPVVDSVITIVPLRADAFRRH